MSTARGGETGGFDPGLEHLIGALTVSGHPHELAGRDAARAAFIAASRQPTAARSARSARSASNWSAWWRRPIRIALPARLAVSIAAVVAVLGGLTAAAAAQVLPPQVQQIAYHVLSPLGVPVSKPAPPHGGSVSPRHHSPGTGPAASQGGCQCSAAPSPSASSAASPHPKAKAKAKPKAKKPDTKPVLRLLAARPHKDYLRVHAPSARPGDIVNLTEWSGTAWITIASGTLGPALRANFVLPVSTAAGHNFEADVLEGASHAVVASNRLWVPRPAKTGAKAIQPSPSPSPTASPTGTESPAPTPTPSTSLAATTATATPGLTTTPTGTPTPTGSPTPTGTPTPTGSPTRTPDPSASASAAAPATSAPPPMPEPSASDSGQQD